MLGGRGLGLMRTLLKCIPVPGLGSMQSRVESTPVLLRHTLPYLFAPRFDKSVLGLSGSWPQWPPPAQGCVRTFGRGSSD
eukprot:8900560-Pyramimonas_sp.AAC.1